MSIKIGGFINLNGGQKPAGTIKMGGFINRVETPRDPHSLRLGSFSNLRPGDLGSDAAAAQSLTAQQANTARQLLS